MPGPTKVGPGDLNDPAFWRARLGEKVSVRFRTRGDPSYPVTEAVGVVAAVEGTDSVVTVLTRRGEARSAPVSDLLAAKLF